ncbi:MAG: sulfatase-like hydrolase/transferase [Planctomycetota bacterium]
MSDRPNVLWILCDQLRGQALGDDPNAVTPSLDRLVARGRRFVNCFSHYPICTPARGGIVTGLYAHANGCRVQGDLLPPGNRTIAHCFNDAGYRTGWVGKWHLGSVSGVDGWQAGADYWVHPHLRGGFADWIGFEASNHYYRTRYSVGDRMWPPLELDGYQTDALTDLFLQHLAALGAEQPWFQVLSLEAPHPGCDEHGVYRHPAPPQWEAMFDPAQLELRGNVPRDIESEARTMLAGYYAQLANLDHNVGRVLDAIPDDTLVLFFSDHGEMGGSHGLFEKSCVYDEALRVPLVIAGPGVEAGTTDALASLLDVMPTTCGLAGVDCPDTHGIDVQRQTRDHVLAQWLGPALFGGYDFQFRALRTATHTYAESTTAEHRVLFNNAEDPLQLANRYGEPTNLAERLSEACAAVGDAW